MKKILILLLTLSGLFISCEETIELDIETGETEIVVDGYIETGLPPYVLLSRTTGYFDPISFSSLISDAVTGALVFVSDGFDTVRLSELTINGDLQEGLYVALDTVSSGTLMIGVPGRTYRLWIQTTDGDQLSAEAKLEMPVALDSVWFQLSEGNDSLGLAYGILNEPDSLGNCYRWHAKRIGKDSTFIAPFGAVFDDRFINGQHFELFYNRGRIQNSQSEDDFNEEEFLFKTGDTIVVKFASVGRAVFEFWRIAEHQIANNGSPFAVPSIIPDNIEGGTGLFSTYSPAYDTIIARP